MIIPFNFFFLSVLLILCKENVKCQNSSIRVDNDCECGNINAIDQRIVGGQETLPHEYPWMAAILYQGQLLCGGSLINNQYILTAGHCLKWVEKEKLSVVLGAHDRILVETERRGGLFVDIENVRVHEDFESHKFHDSHDIGLIKLKHPVKYSEKINPICLPTVPGEKYVHKTAVIIGWGMVGYKSTPPRYLQKAEIKTISNEDCKKVPIIGGLILDSMLCAYMKETDACQGDSGGPLMFETNTGKMEQIGVVSWGIGCAKKGMPGIYTRTNSFLEWITLHTKNATYCKNTA